MLNQINRHTYGDAYSNREGLKYYLYFTLIYVSLVMPYFINLLFGLQSTSAGFIFGQLILFGLFSYKVLFTKYNLRKIIFTYSLLCLFFISAILSSSESISTLVNAFVFIVTICITLLNALYLSFFISNNSQIFYKFISFSWYLTFIISVISLLILPIGFFIFGEGSFFALFFGPLTCIFAILNKRYWSLAFLLIIYAFLIPNLTIILFAFIIMSLAIRLKYVVIVFLLLALTISPSLFGEYVSARVTLNAQDANISSLLYLINWFDLKTRVFEFIILGDGIGQASSGIEMGNDYVEELRKRYEKMNSISTGTFISAHLTRSIGIIGIVPGIFLLLVLAKSFWKVKMQPLSEANAMVFVLCASLMPSFLFRAAGLLSFSTFLFMLTVFYIFSQKKMKR